MSDLKSDLKRPIITLISLLAAVVVVYILFIVFAAPRRGAPTTSSEAAYAPQPSAESARIAAAPQSFEALVSYTDRGFEPPDITVKEGETIRFANNSSKQLWVAATASAGSPLYPGASECGGSAFDSCGALAPHAFWEFTFGETGAWSYKDGVGGASAIVRVK